LNKKEHLKSQGGKKHFNNNLQLNHNELVIPDIANLRRSTDLSFTMKMDCRGPNLNLTSHSMKTNENWPSCIHRKLTSGFKTNLPKPDKSIFTPTSNNYKSKDESLT